MTEIKLTRKEFIAMGRVGLGGDWDGIKSLRESFRGKGYSLFVKNKAKPKIHVPTNKARNIPPIIKPKMTT